MSATAPPVWLDQEPEILSLLCAVLDHFDRQPAEARQRSVSIAANKHLHSLARMDAQADQTWTLVAELERLEVLAIRAPRRNPYDPLWHRAKLVFSMESEVLLREWLRRERVLPAMQQWREAVLRHASRFPDGIEPLLTRRIVIPHRSADEVVAALGRVVHATGPTSLRQLSAYAFWGDSKVLDDREELIAALFPRLILRDRPVVVSVFLPATITGILFIENQDPYTAAADGEPLACANLALVYLAGFRSTAARIRRPQGARLHFAGAATERAWFERWWFDAELWAGPVHFWGDLDFAGMHMLKILRVRFAGVSAWRPGYEPLLAALRNGRGRARSSVESSRQVDPIATGCAYADEELLPAIRELGFLDQEYAAHAADRALEIIAAPNRS